MVPKRCENAGAVETVENQTMVSRRPLGIAQLGDSDISTAATTASSFTGIKSGRSRPTGRSRSEEKTEDRRDSQPVSRNQHGFWFQAHLALESVRSFRLIFGLENVHNSNRGRGELKILPPDMTC